MVRDACIGGARFDAFFFFGSAGLAAALGGLVLAAPALVVPLWWLWLWLVDGPHFAATWARTYLDGQERRRRRGLLLGSLVLLAPGLLALAAARALAAPWPFELFLALAALWAWHHAVRQHFGILAIYHRLTGTGPRLRRLDAAFLHLVLWAMFLLFLLVYPWNRQILGITEEVYRALRPATFALAAVIGLAAAAQAASILLRRRRGLPIKPALFALVPAAGTSALAFFLVGAFEPLVPQPANPEQASFAVAIVAGTLHGLQYLGIVFAANRRRYADPRDRSVAAALGRAPGRAYLVLVAVSLAYLAVNAARGVSPVGSLLAYDSDGARLFLALYWGLSLHHYYIDQKIWRPGRDPVLRHELGLARA